MNRFPEWIEEMRVRPSRVKEELRITPYINPYKNSRNSQIQRDSEIRRELMNILEETLKLMEEWADSKQSAQSKGGEASQEPDLTSHYDETPYLWTVEVMRELLKHQDPPNEGPVPKVREIEAWEDIWSCGSKPYSPAEPKKIEIVEEDGPVNSSDVSERQAEHSNDTPEGDKEDFDQTLKVIQELWFQNQNTMEQMMVKENLSPSIEEKSQSMKESGEEDERMSDGSFPDEGVLIIN